MIVVTGATGHLGRLVVDGLLEKTSPDQVAAAVRDPRKADDLAARGVQVREADYDRPETLAAAFAGAEKVLLISSSTPGQRLAQHQAVIDAAREAACAPPRLHERPVRRHDEDLRRARPQGDRAADPGGGHPVHRPAQRLVHRELRGDGAAGPVHRLVRGQRGRRPSRRRPPARLRTGGGRRPDRRRPRRKDVRAGGRRRVELRRLRRGDHRSVRDFRDVPGRPAAWSTGSSSSRRACPTRWPTC